MKVTQEQVKTILTHYLVAALWTGVMLDGSEECKDDFSIEDCSEELKADSKNDIENMLLLCSELLDSYKSQVSNWEEQFGHDFWLTRNGHGAGFWDRGLGDLGKQLTEKAKTFCGIDLWYSQGLEKVCI